jgi:hypothetical protein
MPVGAEVTVPVPVPEIVTVNNGFSVKVAVTDLAASIVTLHGSTGPLHAPDQAEKTELADGVAVSVTTVLRLYGSEQSAPQVIPAGLEVTVPIPVPAVVTASNRVGTTVVVKVAVTDFARSIVTSQVGDVPLHAPDQLEKTEFTPGVRKSHNRAGVVWLGAVGAALDTSGI